jgi:gliding motility-associated-like protein
VGWALLSGQNTNTITVIPSATSGTVTVKVSNNCGLSTQKTLAVSPSTGGVARPGVLVGPTGFCSSAEEKEYSITDVAGASAYEWSLPAGWEIISGQGTTKIKVKVPAGVGTISVKAKNGCGISEPSQLQVTATPPLTAQLLITDESSPCIGNQFSVPAAAGVTYKWSLVTTAPGWSITSGQGTNQVKVEAPANAHVAPAQIKVEASNGTCTTSSAVQDITPRYLAPVLNIPNVFSPNNDGQNDVWVLRNLQEFPNNDLVILNRWGSEVYRMKNYANNWNGSGLAEGTYFYVLRVRLCDNQEVTHKGYVTVMR